MPAPYFPVALRLEGRKCVVVGTSEDASVRASTLSEHGARVTAVAKASDADLDGAFLVVLVERDTVVAAELAAACDQRGILFCAVDQPEYGAVSNVAVARAGGLRIAITTSGRAPALARRLREEIEKLLSTAPVEAFVEELADIRAQTPSEGRKDVLGRQAERLAIDGQIRIAKK